MSINTHPSSTAFADWIQASDDHAAQHLALLAEARRILAGEGSTTIAARRALADRLERWRYQRLNQRCGRLESQDRDLVAILDQTARELAGRAVRPPRCPRAAIGDAAFDPPAIARVEECLSSQTELAAVTQEATRLTREHFGPPAGNGPTSHRWRMLLYAPLYLSNYCINHCRYCGFRHPNEIPRKHLSVDEALREAGILIGRGFRHILLVAGDFPSLTRTEYFVEVVGALRARGGVPAIEIAPQSTEAYAAMVEAGACGVALYQETYLEELYALYHPRGSKVSFDWRLEGLERAAEAGVRRLGLGFLLGLSDPREDLAAMMRHAEYLRRRFPDRTLAFSLPRIHAAPPEFQKPVAVEDEMFIRLYCALRIAFPQAELVLSTREQPELRNRLAGICITQISAGSSTAPGGYEASDPACRAGEQFPVCDSRSPAEMAAWLETAGFEVAWSLRQ